MTILTKIAQKSLQKETQEPKKKGILQLKQIKDTGDLQRRAMTIGFYGAAGFVGYKFLLQPIWEKMRRRQEEKIVSNDPNRQQATIIYNAMNTSGFSWM